MIPNPGSKEAREAGCTCPILDNNYGRGNGYSKSVGIVFVVNEDCPLHGKVVADDN